MVDDPKRLPQATHLGRVVSPQAGYITSIDCEALGTGAVVLGGGREKKEDSIDPAVGLVLHKKVGERVEKGDVLCTLHYNAESRATRARQMILESYRIGEAPPGKRRALVHRVITKAEKA